MHPLSLTVAAAIGTAMETETGLSRFQRIRLVTETAKAPLAAPVLTPDTIRQL